MKIENIFKLIGSFSAKYSILVIIFINCFAFVFLISLFLFNFEKDLKKFYINKESKIYNQKLFYDKNFGEIYNTNKIILKFEKEKNILKKEYIKILWELQDKIENSGIIFSYKNWTIKDFCYKPMKEKGCLIKSPYNLWKANKTLFENDNNIKTTVKCLKDVQNNNLMPCFSEIDLPVQLNSIFGQLECENKSNDEILCNKTAKSLIINYYFNNDHFVNKVFKIWEKNVFQKEIINFNNNQTIKNLGLKFYYISENSVIDEYEINYKKNLIFVIIIFILLFLFNIFILSENFKFFRILTSFACVYVICLTFLFTYALISIFNIKQNFFFVGFIFILELTISLNNMLIIINNKEKIYFKYSNIIFNLTIEEIIGKIFEEIGPSFLISFLTQFILFLFGCFSNILLIKNFCLSASFVVLFNYILQMTLFIAFMSLEEKRFLKKRKELKLKNLEEKHCLSNKWIQEKLSNDFFYFILNEIIQLVFIILYLILTIYSFISLKDISLGLNQQILFSENENVYNFLKIKQNQTNEPSFLVLNNINYSNDYNIDLINKITDHLSHLKTVKNSIYFWFNDFTKFIKNSFLLEKCYGENYQQLINKTFDEQVKKFLKIKVNSECCKFYGVCGEIYENDIIFDKNNEIKISRLLYFHNFLAKEKNFIESREETNEIIKKYKNKFIKKENDNESNSKIDSIFTYSLFYIYYDHYLNINAKTIEQILIGMGIIFLIVHLKINMKLTFFILFLCLSILMNLIGIINLLNHFEGFKMELNLFSLLNIIIIFVFNIDFFVPIIISILNGNSLNQTQNIKISLHYFGTGVFIIFIVLIGIIILIFSPLKLFKFYYFKFFLIFFFVEFFHIFVLLPIFLLLFNFDNDYNSKFLIVIPEENDVDNLIKIK